MFRAATFKVGAAGVHLPMAGSEGFDRVIARIEQAAARLERQAMAIVDDEARKVVKRLQVRSPVKTGAFRASWRWTKVSKWVRMIVNSVPYAEHVHKKGEKGRPFWRKYAMPEIDAAVGRMVARLQALLAKSVSGRGAGGTRMVRGGRMRLR